MIWDKIKASLASKFSNPELGNRRESLIGNTVKYNNTAGRTDKDSQAAIQDDIASGRKIEISSPQSSRFKISDKDQKERGLSKNDTLYTADDIADMRVDTKKEVAVSSSAVRKLKYNPKTKELKIIYTSSGTEYTFPNVPSEVVTEFLDSPSKGKFLAHYIKPKYSDNKRRR